MKVFGQRGNKKCRSCCVELFDVKGTVYVKEVKSKRKAKKKLHEKQVLELHYHCGLPVNGQPLLENHFVVKF